MLRFHSLALAEVISQLYTPSSAVVTLKIIRVICPLTHVTLSLEVKTEAILTNDVDDGTIAATATPSSCNNTETGSCARVNVQFSRLLIPPI